MFSVHVSIERNLLKSTERKFGEKSVYRRARPCRRFPKDLAVFAFLSDFAFFALAFLEGLAILDTDAVRRCLSLACCGDG